MPNAAIIGWGHYAPERVVTNDDLAQIVDTSDEWIRTRSGIKERHFAGGQLPPLEWINLRSFRDPMLLNGELTVDHDGTLYHGNGFLIRTAEPSSFRAGHLGDLGSFDSLAARRPDNATLVGLTYPEEVARDNRSVGRIYGSFVRHMRGRFPELSRVAPTQAPSPGERR